MCLAIPARLVEKKDNTGVVELGGIRRDIRLDLLPDAKIGDFVLLHTGFAIEVVEEQTAKDMLETIEQAFGGQIL